MIESFAACFGRLDGNTKIFFYPGLPDEFFKASGTQVRVQRNIFSQRFARNYTRYGRLLK
jgi:hypothetical protein